MSDLSPMMMQWHECKKKAPAALLFFRLGDFYEAFYDDALIIAKTLDLTLTKRQDVPMAGVPFHASEGYIDKLVANGFRVAIAEQMEDPKTTKGLVKRDVVRVITPGTVINSSLLTDKSNHFLACVTQLNATFGLSTLDVTTAEFQAIECDNEKQLIDELCRLRPKEILLPEKWLTQRADLLAELRQHFNPALHSKPLVHFDHAHAYSLLTRHFQVHTLDGFGLNGMTAAISAAGAILDYLTCDLSLSIDHIRSIRSESISQYMLLDRSTQRHLELTESIHEDKNHCTLLDLLDQTMTPMGGRLLKQWIIHPLLDVDAISARQEAIEDFIRQRHLFSAVKEALSSIRDLERLIMRIETGHAAPRDLVGLRFSLESIPALIQSLRSYGTPLLQEALTTLLTLPPLAHKIAQALVDAPPLRLSDGHLFNPGFSPLLDEINALCKDSQSWIAHYQSLLRESTQIKTLKVGYTKAFGFYIEVSRGQSDRVPDTFQRRQTLINAERFITPELKEYEYKVLHAEERRAAIEHELFHALRQEVSKEAFSIRKIAKAVGLIDTLFALAQVAIQHDYVRPIMDRSDLLHIEGGRHPVIEATLPPHRFVPNEVLLNQSTHKMRLITGPNMAGKSTYIRQVALIVILAQIGSFVPAKSAHIGIVDQVFSRIGANDDLSRGQSTFMVEMAETANILNHATSRSLVILDEIGRGTSTYDGISIAWAVAEYLLTTPNRSPKTLFATHYCELTELESKVPGANNYCVAVHETQTGISFLHKIVRGSTDKSYGIHVGKLAGLPLPVLKRASEILVQLEKTGKRPYTPKQLPAPHDSQMTFLVAMPTKEQESSLALLKELQAIDPNLLSPMDALKKLMEWKEKCPRST